MKPKTWFQGCQDTHGDIEYSDGCQWPWQEKSILPQGWFLSFIKYDIHDSDSAVMATFFMKVDIEGSELTALPQWIESGALDKVGLADFHICSFWTQVRELASILLNFSIISLSWPRSNNLPWNFICRLYTNRKGNVFSSLIKYSKRILIVEQVSMATESVATIVHLGIQGDQPRSEHDGERIQEASGRTYVCRWRTNPLQRATMPSSKSSSCETQSGTSLTRTCNEKRRQEPGWFQFSEGWKKAKAYLKVVLWLDFFP